MYLLGYTGTYYVKIYILERMKTCMRTEEREQKGQMTTRQTGFSLEYVQRIVNELKELTYEPKPVRRAYIGKRNGKLRPLGVPSFRDKLVQDAMKTNT